MNTDQVKSLLNKKENIRLEYKEASTDLPKNLFESVCAMLNRDGGDIILGVNDAGAIIGVDESKITTMMENISNLSNNPQKVEPPFILFPQKHEIDKKWIIHIQVPAGSQVHKTAGIIYDRSSDGDFKVTQTHQIAELQNSKRSYYTENIVYPALRFDDFKKSLFPKIRNLMRSYKPNHPWLSLNDRGLLIKAGLWKQDYQTSREGYTLAAALLFGKDEVIQSIIPHYKIDAIVRIEDITRYDDREYIQTNLIEAYEVLMNFSAKHLPDKFYLEGGQRISLRAKIFREIIANLIVHREYTNAYPCKFIIYADKVETENAGNPKYYGKINPSNFTPYPKNPTIAKFFLQLGIVEELGSGVLNVSNLAKEYSNGQEASFIEGDVFKMIIPLPTKDGGVNVQDGGVNTEGGGVNQEDGGVSTKDGGVNVQDGGVSTEGGGVNQEDGGVSTEDGGVNQEDGGVSIEGGGVNPEDGGVNVQDGGVSTEDGGVNIIIVTDLLTSIIKGSRKSVIISLSDIVNLLLKNKNGASTERIVNEINKAQRTIERHLKTLRDQHIIEFKGSPKTGGYYLTEEFLRKINN